MKQIFLTLILFLSLASPAWATVYWVATTGSDANACSAIDSADITTDPGTYKLSITSASACASAGDTVIVKAGVYTATQFTTTVSGSSGASRIRYLSQTLNGAILRPTTGEFLWSQEGSFTTIEGFDLDGSSNGGAANLPMFINANDVSLINNKIHDWSMSQCTAALFNNGGTGVAALGANLIATNNQIYNIGLSLTCGPGAHGIYNQGTGGGSMSGNLIHHVHDHGIITYPNTTTAVTISGNTVHNVQRGIWLLTGNGHSVYNNLLYNNGTAGIQIETDNHFIYNNTVGGTTSDIIFLQTTANGNTVRNNISIPGGAVVDSGSGNTINTNTTTGTAASHFADSANGDFRLCSEAGVPSANCAGASTAVGAGVDLSGTFTTDIVGSLRVVPWDIGAYKAVSQSPTPPTPALVLQISCDGAVTDSSLFANHGALTNGATYNASGKYGSACQFDGINDHVLVADSASLDTTHGFTLEAWVKPAAPITTDQLVIQKAGGVDGSYYMQAGSTGICGTGAPMGGYEQGVNVTACYTTPLTDSIWTHMAVNYDPTGTPNVRLYLNAVEMTNAVGSAILSANAGALYIGSTNGSGYFSGLIDEIRIYNYARSPAQITDDMNTPINAPAPPSNRSMGASATARRRGASATAHRTGGSLTFVPVTQVAFDSATESHTGITGSVSQSSFTINHTVPVSTGTGLLVFTFNANSNANDATSVKIGAGVVDVPPVTAATASDTSDAGTTDPGSCRAWFLGSGVPTGAQTITINRNNNANVMYAVAITTTAGATTAVIGTPVLQQNNAVLAESSIDTGAIIAQRFACAYHGGNNIPAAGSNSTMLHSIDFGSFTAGAARETTPGSGNRPTGMTSVSNDRAQVVLAIGIP